MVTRAAINTFETVKEKEIAAGKRPTVEPDGMYVCRSRWKTFKILCSVRNMDTYAAGNFAGIIARSTTATDKIVISRDRRILTQLSQKLDFVMVNCAIHGPPMRIKSSMLSNGAELIEYPTERLVEIRLYP